MDLGMGFAQFISVEADGATFLILRLAVITDLRIITDSAPFSNTNI